MLCKAVKFKVKKIIYASSSSVYRPIDENKKINEKEHLIHHLAMVELKN